MFLYIFSDIINDQMCIEIGQFSLQISYYRNKTEGTETESNKHCINKKVHFNSQTFPFDLG